MPHNITIYTDGAASGNPGPGGYGVVLMAGPHRKELSEGFRRTTNNRMELEDKGRTPELGIVNFDAHFDLRPYDMGNSSGTMFRQMADVCRAEGTPYHYFPIG